MQGRPALSRPHPAVARWDRPAGPVCSLPAPAGTVRRHGGGAL